MRKLSWKILVTTFLLILLVIGLISIPIYWQTRLNMENQLSSYMRNELKTLKTILEPQLENEYVSVMGEVNASLNRILKRYEGMSLASNIYLANKKGILLAFSNSREAAGNSLIKSNDLFQRALNGAVLCSPVFKDKDGNHYKSGFININMEDNEKGVLGINASAKFLTEVASLRNNMLIFGGVAMIISLILAAVLSNTLTGPLTKLTRYTSEIGRKRPDKEILENRNDEIGFLARTIYEMHQKIVKREKENKRLVASVAHEIRNPLAGARVNAELLAEEAANYPKLNKKIRAVLDEIGNLNRITNTFLAYARPIRKELSVVHIEKLIHNTIEKLHSEFPNISVPIEGTATLKGDSAKLKHVFYNLIKNAIEATNDTEEILISIKNKKDTIRIAVQNKGEPVPPELQSQIFEAFFTTRDEGIGLGLSISKSLVEQHGGEIFLNYSNDNGTEFVILLPAF